MKRNYLLSVIFILFFVTGCIGPLKRFKAAENKTAAIEKKIEANKDQLLEKSKGYVFGADYSLGLDPAPSKYGTVAKSLTERSLEVTGPTVKSEVVILKEMVDNLLSTNA